MRITHIEASGIFGRRYALDIERTVLVIMGPNGAGKTSLLRLPELALMPPSKGVFPLLDERPAPFRVEVVVERDGRASTVTREYSAAGRHTAAINGKAPKLADVQSALDRARGDAGAWSIGDLIAMQPDDALQWMRERIGSTAGTVSADEIDPLRDAIKAAIDGYTVPDEVTADVLDAMLAKIDAAHREADSYARTHSHDADDPVPDVPDIGDLDRRITALDDEITRLRDAQHMARARVEHQGAIDEAEAAITQVGTADPGKLRVACEAAIDALRVKRTKAREEAAAARKEFDDQRAAAAPWRTRHATLTAQIEQMPADDESEIDLDALQAAFDDADKVLGYAGVEVVDIEQHWTEITERGSDVAAADKIAEAAVTSAQAALNRAAEPVPCPHCGKPVDISGREQLQADLDAAIGTRRNTAAELDKLRRTAKKVKADRDALRDAHIEAQRAVDAAAKALQDGKRLVERRALVQQLDALGSCPDVDAARSEAERWEAAVRMITDEIREAERARDEQIDALDRAIAERNRHTVAIAGIGEVPDVDEDTITAKAADLHRLRGEANGAREMRGVAAEIEERIDALEAARARRTSCRELIAALGPAGVQGRMLSGAFPDFRDAVDGILQPVAGLSLWMTTDGGLRWGYESPDEGRVPYRTACQSRRALLLTAFEVVARSHMDGYRAVVLDEVQYLDPDLRTALVRRLAELADEGVIDEARLACRDDGWTPPDMAQIVRMPDDALVPDGADDDHNEPDGLDL